MRRRVRLAMAAAAAMAFAAPAPALAATDLDRPLPAGVVVRGADAGCIVGTRAGGSCDRASTDIDLMFVDPADPAQRASTASFSILVDPGSKAMVTAYDASGRLLGIADRVDGDGDGDGGGERLSVAGLGDIARVHISGRGPVAYDDLRFDGLKAGSRLPEPATWAMLILGFVLTGAAIRRRIRRSEARFTERVRRIAAGEAG